MFRGTHEAKIDEKGRLKLPADFMKLMAEKNYGPTFFITSRDGQGTEVWPMQEWEIEEAKKAILPEDDPAKITWMRIVNHFGGVVEIDKQDRLMLPKKVRERFSLVNAEVVVTGQQRFLKVQTEQEAEQEIAGLLAPKDESAKLMSIAEARLILAKRESPNQGGS
jgi:transcriptional regulator MraZ